MFNKINHSNDLMPNNWNFIRFFLHFALIVEFAKSYFLFLDVGSVFMLRKRDHRKQENSKKATESLLRKGLRFSGQERVGQRIFLFEQRKRAFS